VGALHASLLTATSRPAAPSCPRAACMEEARRDDSVACCGEVLLGPTSPSQSAGAAALGKLTCWARGGGSEARGKGGTEEENTSAELSGGKTYGRPGGLSEKNMVALLTPAYLLCCTGGRGRGRPRGGAHARAQAGYRLHRRAADSSYAAEAPHWEACKRLPATRHRRSPRPPRERRLPPRPDKAARPPAGPMGHGAAPATHRNDDAQVLPGWVASWSPGSMHAAHNPLSRRSPGVPRRAPRRSSQRSARQGPV
jgi:hypothetical protein